MTREEAIISLRELMKSKYLHFSHKIEIGKVIKALEREQDNFAYVVHQYHPEEPEDTYCGKCGEELQGSENYCPNCGAKIVRDDPSHPFADDVMMEAEKDEYEKAIDTLKANYNNFSEELKRIVDRAIEAAEKDI